MGSKYLGGGLVKWVRAARMPRVRDLNGCLILGLFWGGYVEKVIVKISIV